MLGHNLIGIDYGLVRVGLSVGNNIVKVAQPLQIIHSRSMQGKLYKMNSVVQCWQPKLFVLGTPNNKDSVLMNSINKFSKLLSKKFSTIVTLIDESYSSSEAEIILATLNIKYKSKELDKFAAAIILQSYFDRLQC